MTPDPGILANIKLEAAQRAAWGREQVTLRTTRWMWDGVPMDVVEFARHAYGDSSQATHFILRYKNHE